MTDSARSERTVAAELIAASRASARAAGLVYVADTLPGIRRARDGTAFVYSGPDERPITDPAELKRIASLAVPPAYEDVWICPKPNGHLQATGRDARGRKQYRYHPQWRSARDGAKFERMAAFGDALPRLRRRLRADLARPGMPREKVLAIVVSLLDATRVRIGNAGYARDNNSFGLTTLRNRHVRFGRSGGLLLKFRGKGGAEHEVPIDDPRLVRLIGACHQLPGQHLFQYVDEAGELRRIDSDQVNAYLGAAMRDEFTAKDFRTWGATLRAIVILRGLPLPERRTERALNACIVETVRTIAGELRNTPAVCRKSYINPAVFDAWRTGQLHALLAALPTQGPRQAERAAVRFLRRYVPAPVASGSSRATRRGAAPSSHVDAASPLSKRRVAPRVAPLDRSPHVQLGH